MFSFKCKLCERARLHEKMPRKKIFIFKDIESLYNHVLRYQDAEHSYFRRKLDLPSRNHKKKLRIFKKAIYRERHLWIHEWRKD